MNSSSLNKLRAAVLGANDGIISVATALIAVMGVFGAREIALTAGAVLFAGALSMAAGEYVSVSAQVHHEKDHESALEKAAALQAAVASFISFLAGGLLPVIAAIIFQNALLVIVISLALLVFTGWISADKKAKAKSTIKLATVGVIAFGISYAGNLTLQWIGV